MIRPTPHDDSSDSTPGATDPPAQDVEIVEDSASDAEAPASLEPWSLQDGEPADSAPVTATQSRLLTGQPVRAATLRPGLPPPSLRPLLHGSGQNRTIIWVALIFLVIAAGIAAIVFGPDVIALRKQRELEQQAEFLSNTGKQHLQAGRFDEAETSAKQALKLLPKHAAAKQVIDSAGILRGRQRQRQESASAALASAEKLADNDDIPAAISAFDSIRANSSNPKEIIRQAEERLTSLRGATGTLVLPKDWPEYAVLSIDDKPQPPGVLNITGISFGKHTLTVTRHGHRQPPPMELEFRGARPVSLPAIAWQPVGGKVTITSNPPGAGIWKSGRNTGKTTPCTFDDVDAGIANYQLKLPGHLDTSIEGVVLSGRSIDLTASLPDLPRLPKDGKKAGERQEFNLTATLRVPFRWCPAGSFTMGGTDAAATDAEKPARSVRLTQGFWLAETEFTQGQWEAITGTSLQGLAPGGARPIGQGPEFPVYFVSWDQICGNNSRSGGILAKINAFVQKHAGPDWTADLPTEAQWEYACRAGTTTAFGTAKHGPAAFDASAWHRTNSDNVTHPVGTREANPWGFKDMHGNVFEWCRDWYQDNYQKLPDSDPVGPKSGWKIVVRGGSCQSQPALCRSAARGQIFQTVANPLIGFRLALRHREAPAAKTPPPAPKKQVTPAAKPKPKPQAKPQPKPKPKPKPPAKKRK